MRRSLVSAFALAASAAGALTFFACADDPHLRTTPDQAQTTGGACEAEPGTLPPPDCDDSEKTCDGVPGCSIDEARCGSPSTCLPTADNRGKDVLDFRIRRLNIASPAALAADFIQNTIVNLNIDLDEKSCGELGKGLFTWLLRYDKSAGTILTGGAPPTGDPLGRGFCFARFDLGANKVEPITLRVEEKDGTLRTIEQAPVRIPIFLDADPASSILLPIRDVRIEGLKITEDGNCIGRFNRDALGATCNEDRVACPKWQTSASLGGYITLEEADAVRIRDLANKSLCAFLAGEPTTTCARDGAGKITYQGDYCSTDKQAGSCKDSVWLAATFAASAAKIFDGAGEFPACSGATAAPPDGGTPDGGADAGDGG